MENMCHNSGLKPRVFTIKVPFHVLHFGESNPQDASSVSHLGRSSKPVSGVFQDCVMFFNVIGRLSNERLPGLLSQMQHKNT